MLDKNTCKLVVVGSSTHIYLQLTEELDYYNLQFWFVIRKAVYISKG